MIEFSFAQTIKKTTRAMSLSLFKICVLNFITLILLALSLSLTLIHPALGAASAFFVVLFLSLSAGVLSRHPAQSVQNAHSAHSGGINFASLFDDFKSRLCVAAVTFVLLCVFFCIIFIVAPICFLSGGFLGLLLAVLSFWTAILMVSAFQFFFAFVYKTEYKNAPQNKKLIFSALKSCAFLFLKKPLFCFVTMLISIFIIAISLISVMLFPGPAGVLIFLDEAIT